MRMYSLRFPEYLITRLKEIPNASEVVRRAVENELELHSSEIIEAQIAQVDRETTKLLREQASLQEERARLGVVQRAREKRRLKQQDARITLLEFANDNPSVKWDRWLDSRADVVADCGFEGVKDAVDWLQTQKARK